MCAQPLRLADWVTSVPRRWRHSCNISFDLGEYVKFELTTFDGFFEQPILIYGYIN